MLLKLVQEGLFLDGLTYASISRNLAEGKGSIWAPYHRGEAVFGEHPPLMFALEALYFKLFGDKFYTEKLYSFTIWLLTLVAANKLWKLLKPDDKRFFTFTLFLLCWGFTEPVAWSYANNILDITMALFDLLAVYVMCRALHNKVQITQSLITGGIFVFLATFTKGPVGAFPIAIPFIYQLVYSGKPAEIGKGIVQSIIVFVTVAVIYTILYQMPEPRMSVDRYVNQQLLSALQGKREVTVGFLGRFAILNYILMPLLLPIAAGLLMLALYKVSKAKAELTIKKKHLIFLLLVGLCGSLPIMISLKQRAFYMLPALPFFSLALALVLYPYFVSLTDKWAMGAGTFKKFRIGMTVVGVLLTFYISDSYGKILRDRDTINDVKQLATLLPEGSKVSMCAEVEQQFGFLAYAQRYHKLEISSGIMDADHVLTYKGLCNESYIDRLYELNFKQVDEDLPQFDLYELRLPYKFDFMLLNPFFLRGDK